MSGITPFPWFGTISLKWKLFIKDELCFIHLHFRFDKMLITFLVSLN